jgi:HD-GYP domain-containing protein (c-di-GMP phosphodiesterase class II)/pSer/pThr/pTyr-binding forkhead associated (FHA) protein
MPASLHVIEGPDRGRLFTLTGTTVTIGRSAENTIVLNDVAVSGLHSKLVRAENGQYTLHDNASTNGTFVNGKEARVVDLKHGDTVRIGGTTMAFEVRRQGGILPSEGVDRGAVRQDDDAAPYRAPVLIDPTSLERGELERLVRRGSVLEQLDLALAELEGPTEILSAVLDASLAASGALRGFILLVDERTGEIVPSVVRNLSGDAEEIPFSKSLAFDVVAERRPIEAEDAHDGVSRPVLGVPIQAYGRAVGVIHLDGPRGGRFDPDALATVEAIGVRTGPAVAAARSRVDFEVLFSSMIDAMMTSIQAKDVYTRGHSERVRHYSRILGKELGLTGQELYRLTLGAAVHDIGKIGMPDSVLKFNTNPRLTPEQLDEVKKHPARGAKILGEIPFLRDVVAAAELHHEDWNGGGYPHGLKGEEIPLIARIVAVADTYDAITTDRPYQKGLAYEQGHEVLRKIAGKRLDPELVEAFVAAWHRYRKGPARQDVPVAEETHETCKIDKSVQEAAVAAAQEKTELQRAGEGQGTGGDASGPDGPDLGEKLRDIILIG